MEKKQLLKRQWVFVIVIVALFLVYGFFWGQGNFQTVEGDWTKKIMDMPEFSAVDLAGNAHEKADFATYPLTYLYVWSGPEAEENLLALNRAVNNLNGGGVAVLGLIGGDPAGLPDAKALAADLDLHFPQLIPDQALRQELLPLVTVFPTAFLVNGEGEVIGGLVVGEKSGAEVRNIVKTVLAAMK